MNFFRAFKPTSKITGVALLVFLQCLFETGCHGQMTQTQAAQIGSVKETQKNAKDILPIQLAIGSFDPLSGSGPPVLAPELTLQSYPKGDAGYYILQFSGPVLQEWKDAVSAAGARLFDYIPQFAFIVKMNEAAYKKIRTMASVRWIGIYQPGYRIAPGLMPNVPLKSEQRMEIVVLLFQDENTESVFSEVKSMGGEITAVSEKKDRMRLKILNSRIAAIARLNGVKFIEPVSGHKLF